MSHLEERMEADLNAIRDWVWKIGDDVENALHEAKKTLVLRDKELAYRIILGDHPINRASRRCDRMCHRFIAVHLPSAGLMRLISSVIRANIELERVGDYAVTISREALQLSEPPSGSMAEELDRVSKDTQTMLKQAIKALNDQPLKGRPLRVNQAKPRSERGGGGGGGGRGRW